MRLHDLFQDRTSIRILKMLYDCEVVQKGAHTMRLSEARRSLGLVFAPKGSVSRLVRFGLVCADHVDGDMIMSLTGKGKEFIDLFDQILELFMSQGKKMAGRNVRIRYDLTEQEKRIMVLTYRMCKEIGQDLIELKALVEELHPDQSGKTGSVSRYVSRLGELNLMNKERRGRQTFIGVTEAGFRTIREQYLNGLMH